MMGIGMFQLSTEVAIFHVYNLLLKLVVLSTCVNDGKAAG